MITSLMQNPKIMEDERKTMLKLLNSSLFISVIKGQDNKVSKDFQQAELLRKTGNDFYKEAVHSFDSHNGAWKSYSMSIARAENNSESLAMSYGNRSAILLHLSKYEESVRDIDRALNITVSGSLKVKLLLRKAKCLHMMGSKNDQIILKEADKLLGKITDASLKPFLQAELDKVKVILNKPVRPKAPLENKNAKLMQTLYENYKIDDFSLLELQFNEKYGRHLIAAKDITPGEVIYIEKPNVQCVNLLKMHAYCAHCFATVWDNIPCDSCCWAMFCSEKCKNEAWKNYHQIECCVYADFNLDTSDSFTQMALRILSRVLIVYGSIENLKAELSAFEGVEDYKKGFICNGKLQANGLESIYLLCKNIPTNTLSSHVKNTASVLKSFGKNTSFLGRDFDFTNVESYQKNEDAIFLGSLFLRFSKISQLNAFQMRNRTQICQNQLDEEDCCKKECCTAGIYIAPITSLLNHDCFPNVGRCYTSDHTVLVYALQPIKKGAQIFTSYLQIFLDDTLADRQRILWNTYNLKCNCFSCQQKLEMGIIPNNGSTKEADLLQQEFDRVDLELSYEFKDLQKVTDTTTCKTFEKTVIRLSSGLEKAFSPLRPKKLPSVASSSLSGCLEIISDRVYGINLDVPEDCNNV